MRSTFALSLKNCASGDSTSSWRSVYSTKRRWNFWNSLQLEWGPQAEKAFQDLKAAFTTAPILVHPDFVKAFYLETDASDFALRVVLSQMGVDKKLYLVAFYSRKFSAAEIN